MTGFVRLDTGVFQDSPVEAELSATSVVPSAPTAKLVTVPDPVAARRSPLAVTVEDWMALAILNVPVDMTVAISPVTRAVSPVTEVPLEAV
jgi:hypothetical protein